MPSAMAPTSNNVPDDPPGIEIPDAPIFTVFDGAVVDAMVVAAIGIKDANNEVNDGPLAPLAPPPALDADNAPV